jgi:CubicO group peptidase (beta-lactamase class C family)
MSQKLLKLLLVFICTVQINGSLSNHLFGFQALQVETPQKTKTAELLDEIDAYAQKVQNDWKVPGMAIAIVKDDQVIFAKGYGVREINKPEQVDADTLFAIASNSKAFTAASICILVDEGKIKWEDPVTKYLADFQMPDPYVTREMTILDLVCHRSGMDTFSGDLLWYDTTYSADEIIHRIRHLKPVSSFRSKFGYQNLMYIAAGKVIEKVSGQTWAEFVQSRILDPLQMTRTTTSSTTLSDNFALPHNESGGNGLRSLAYGNVDNCWGACGLNSSVNDLAQWMQLQLNLGMHENKKIISANQVLNMWQPNTVVPLSESAIRAVPSRHFQAYGLGFFLYDFHGRKIVTHSGGLDGMISQLAIVPEENLGVVILTNSESSASRFVRDRVLECFLTVQDRTDQSGIARAQQERGERATSSKNQRIDQARIKDTTPTLALQQYAGTYNSKMYGDVSITLENDQLVLTLNPAPNFVADLVHWQYNTFEIKWRDTVKYNFPRGFVNFTIDKNAKPHQLIIDQPNDDFWFYELDLYKVN